jgi:uroporphyrin-III C-methyltransferase
LASESRRGKLYIVGAGPGDPELLTVKAARVIGECDVVLYDRLVSREVLSHARHDAQLIYVGKHPGDQEHTQPRIFELIRQHALDGKTVARLKGGDPFVFGRGAEEWAAAAAHGIEVEVIPGVSSAVATPALAGIPLTYRGVSQSLAVITGHCHQGAAEDWARYAGIDTLVILMGVTHRQPIAQALMAAGRDGDEPIAFIERGTMKGERVIESTLNAAAGGSVEVKSPAVWVIGEVVRVRGQLCPTAPARNGDCSERNG